MPYEVVRTIWLKGNIARNPGNILSPGDLADIPERVRDRQLASLVDSGKLRWIDSPEQKLEEAKAVVEADKNANKKKPGRPPKEKTNEKTTDEKEG